MWYICGLNLRTFVFFAQVVGFAVSPKNGSGSTFSGVVLLRTINIRIYFLDPAGGLGKEVRRNKERPGKFLEAERLSYVAAGRAAFAQTTVLSVVADAVHVGTEDWLNVFVCDPGQNLSFVCPPQAMREGG